jgi:hypothetical protein
MPYQITAFFRGMPKAIGELKNIDRYVKNEAGKVVTTAAFNAAGKVFEENFNSEGRLSPNGWPELEDYTKYERERLGFPAAHPILFRYGDLRLITATSLRIAGGSGTFSATDPNGGAISVSLNIGKNGGYAQATGNKAWNQIETDKAFARPFWFTTRTVTRAMRRQAGDVLADKVDNL